MMQAAIAEVAAEQDSSIGVEVEISIANGEELATRTWNPRLGIVGGLSVLGTTGIVVPYSCAAWIKSIHSGIDVANALGLTHVAGCTGSTSEKTVQNWYQLDDVAMLDMGDFAGGMLKYLRRHPVARLTIGGGFGKLSKLAMGHLDLHSGRSQVNFDELANIAMSCGADGDLTSARVMRPCRQFRYPRQPDHGHVGSEHPRAVVERHHEVGSAREEHHLTISSGGTELLEGFRYDDRHGAEPRTGALLRAERHFRPVSTVV